MKWEWKRLENAQILILQGRFDNYTSPQVRDQILSAAESGEVRLIIDFKNVTFVDSTALATLVQAMKWCRQQGGDLRLCNLRSEVRLIFELTRLDRAFEIFPSPDQAIAAFAVNESAIE